METATATKTVSGAKLAAAALFLISALGANFIFFPLVKLKIADIAAADIIGCRLQLMQGKNINKTIILTQNLTDCEDIFIASLFDGRKDFYRLIYSLGYGGFTQEEILDTNFKLAVFYVDSKGNQNSFGDLQNKLFNQYECGNINFFGIPLYCFNAVGSKPDHLKQIIPLATILKYTSQIKHENKLAGVNTSAHNFIAQSGVQYYDASQPEVYDETLETAKCTGDQGSANYQNVNGKKIVYICDKMLKDTDPFGRIRYAAILYHEANHISQAGHKYSHAEDSNPQYEDLNDVELAQITIKSECKVVEGYQPRRRDWDFKTTYGAHINYLFSLSKNNILPCDEQLYAFTEAETLMKTKLCQYPNKPKHGFTKPACNK